jgi:DNA gyrase subunit A
VLRLVCVGQEDKDTTFDPNKFVIFATRNGTVKRTNLGEFRNIRKDGIIAINIADGDVLIGCELTNGRDEVVLVTHEGMSLRFKEYAEKVTAKEGEPAAEGEETEAEDSSAETEGAESSESGEGKEKGGIRDMGRQATGVRGIKLDKGDYVVSLVTVSTTGTLLVASEKGIGKRSSFDEYRIQSRGGKGIITMKTSEKTGNVARALVVQETDELMLMTSSGQSVRIPVSQIREAGRNTMGVKLIALREGELIQDVAKVVSEEADTPPAEDTTTDAAPAEGATDGTDTPPDNTAPDSPTDS